MERGLHRFARRARRPAGAAEPARRVADDGVAGGGEVGGEGRFPVRGGERPLGRGQPQRVQFPGVGGEVRQPERRPAPSSVPLREGLDGGAETAPREERQEEAVRQHPEAHRGGAAIRGTGRRDAGGERRGGGQRFEGQALLRRALDRRFRRLGGGRPPAGPTVTDPVEHPVGDLRRRAVRAPEVEPPAAEERRFDGERGERRSRQANESVYASRGPGMRGETAAVRGAFPRSEPDAGGISVIRRRK